MESLIAGSRTPYVASKGCRFFPIGPLWAMYLWGKASKAGSPCGEGRQVSSQKAALLTEHRGTRSLQCRSGPGADSCRSEERGALRAACLEAGHVFLVFLYFLHNGWHLAFSIAGSPFWRVNHTLKELRVCVPGELPLPLLACSSLHVTMPWSLGDFLVFSLHSQQSRMALASASHMVYFRDPVPYLQFDVSL